MPKNAAGENPAAAAAAAAGIDKANKKRNLCFAGSFLFVLISP
jgi:hypothetical protein